MHRAFTFSKKGNHSSIYLPQIVGRTLVVVAFGVVDISVQQVNSVGIVANFETELADVTGVFFLIRYHQRKKNSLP